MTFNTINATNATKWELDAELHNALYMDASGAGEFTDYFADASNHFAHELKRAQSTVSLNKNGMPVLSGNEGEWFNCFDYVESRSHEEMAMAMLETIGIESRDGINLDSPTLVAEVDAYAMDNGWHHNGLNYVRDEDTLRQDAIR